MSRTSKKRLGFVLVFFFGMLLITFSPLRSKLRSSLGRLLSQTKVALKKDMVISEETYDWRLTDRKGNLTTFNAFKGEVVFLNFWATWCGPCIAEMPSLQKLYDLYGADVRFLFVTEDDHDKVEIFLKKGFDIPVYYLASTVPADFYSKTIPTTYVIDKKGRIVIAQTDAADWFSDDVKSLLQTLLEE